jgi:hypothetical protein
MDELACVAVTRNIARNSPGLTAKSTRFCTHLEGLLICFAARSLRSKFQKRAGEWRNTCLSMGQPGALGSVCGKGLS